MSNKEIYVTPDPRKRFGKWLIRPEMPTILQTDYKSPPLVIEIQDER